MQLKFDFSLFTGGNYTIAFLAVRESGVFLIHRDPTLQIFIDDGLKPVVYQAHTTVPSGLTHPQEWKWSLVS